jgi:hypothetical protein
MSAEDRIASAERGNEHDELPAHPPPQPAHVPGPVWPGCGDLDYPLSCAAMEDLPSSIQRLSRRWEHTVGSDIIRPELRVDQAPIRTCAEEWGRGHCRARMLADEQRELLGLKSRLTTWASMSKTKDAKFDELWVGLPLFYAGPSGDMAGGGQQMTPVVGSFF